MIDGSFVMVQSVLATDPRCSCCREVDAAHDRARPVERESNTCLTAETVFTEASSPALYPSRP